MPVAAHESAARRAATATAGDTLTGSINLTLSSAGFITFSFMGRRDLRTSVTTMGDKSNVSIMDIFNISCNAASPAGCLSNANADGVIFQFAPDGDASNGSDINGNHTLGSLDPFSLNMTAGTNDPATARAFTNGFAMFSLTSNFALPAGSYTLNFSKSTRTDIVVIDPPAVPVPATLLLLGQPTAAHWLLPHPAQLTWKLEGPERAYEHFGLPFLVTTSELYQRIRNIQIRILPDDQLLAVELAKYDQKIVLEALHNCIAHQDYSLNSRIIVTEKINKLIFENAGRFFI